MALSTPNVNIVTDSFQNWIDKTNTLLDAYSTTIVTTAANSEGGTTTGNGTVNGIFTANSLTVNGNTTFGLRGGNTTVASVLYITSNVSIGNTSVNTVFTTTTIDTDLALTVLGATTLSNSLSVTGTTTLTGNVTMSGALQTISGNVNIDSGVLFVDATNDRIGINNTAPGVALRVTGATDISLTANVQGAANVGGTFGVAGVTTLTGNAILNGTLQTISGNVNFDTGTLFVDAANNRVGINNTTPSVALEVTGAANISTSVNSASFTVGANLIANTTGIYHTGVIDAARFTTTGLVANTSALVATSNNILLGNSIGRFVISANTGDFSGNVVISGTANVGSNLRVTGNVSINTFATFLTLANTDLGSNTTADRTVVSFPKESYQAGELLVYVTRGVEFQTTKILFVHNGTDVNQTVYGTVVAPPSSDPLAANIALSVNSTNIDVTLRQRSANSTVKIIANMIS